MLHVDGVEGWSYGRFEMKSFRLLEYYFFYLSLWFAIAIVKVVSFLGSRPWGLEIVWVKWGRGFA
jgi:hypothetical protein